MSTVRANTFLDSAGGNTATINSIPLRPGILDPENRIINGAFDFWQRGTSFTTNTYGADRWYNGLTGGTVTSSRQSFAVGDTLGSNSPTFFLRQTVSGQTLASHVAYIAQPLEGVRSYAGQTITVLGWSRRSSGAGSMAVEFQQNFGTGGSPSATVNGIGVTTVSLTGSWVPFAITVNVPSITGKTLGTNGNDSFQITFWNSAGSDFNARTNSLGLQTIGVDLWGIHIKLGTHTVDAVSLYKQPELGPELARCQRYYETGNAAFTTYQLNTTGFGSAVIFAVQKRSAPTIAFPFTTFLNASTLSTGILTASCVEILAVATANGAAQYRTQFTADAEL